MQYAYKLPQKRIISKYLVMFGVLFNFGCVTSFRFL